MGQQHALEEREGHSVLAAPRPLKREAAKEFPVLLSKRHVDFRAVGEQAGCRDQASGLEEGIWLDGVVPQVLPRVDLGSRKVAYLDDTTVQVQLLGRCRLTALDARPPTQLGASSQRRPERLTAPPLTMAGATSMPFTTSSPWVLDDALLHGVSWPTSPGDVNDAAAQGGCWEAPAAPPRVDCSRPTSERQFGGEGRRQGTGH